MPQLTYSSFEVASCQATIFTPDGELSPSKVMKEFYPKWSDLLDDDPTIVPPFKGFPGEVPRIILQDKSGSWRLEVAFMRINFFWKRTDQDQSAILLEDFFKRAICLFSEYQELTSCNIGRLAAVLARFAVHSSPGLFLARHFCQTRWDEKPLNRPESFELHAHKRFSLADKFDVNSWARSKTGHIKTRGIATPIVLFEQDLNTLAEEEKKRSFSPEEIEHFFETSIPEFDSILQKYYPNI